MNKNLNAVVKTDILGYIHLKTRAKERVPKCVEMYIKDKPKIMSSAIKNVFKRSSMT